MAKSSWTLLLVAFFTGVIAALVQFAIPPVLPLIREQYQVSYTDSALLMSLFALATVASAIPGGFIMPKFGVRAIGLWGLGILLAGLVGFALSTSFPFLVIMRIVQGFGFGLIAVAAPSAIGQYIPQEKMSIAMGIWSAWIPFSSMTMFFFAPKIIQFSMNTYWILLISLTLIVILFFARTIPRPMAKETGSFIPAKQDLLAELKNANLWWAGGGFATYSLAFLTFNTWITTVLVESASIPLASATIVPALLAIFAIWSNVFAGAIYKKSGYPLLLFVMPPLAIACLWPMFTLGQTTLLYSSAIIIGCLGGFVPAILFTAVPLLAKRKETVGIGLSMVIFMQNVGGLIGPQFFGSLRQNTGGFASGFWMLLLFGLFTVYACYKIWRTGIFATGIKAKEPVLKDTVLSREA